MGGFYVMSGPVAAIAANANDIQEGYAAISQVCLGDKFLGFLPVSKSYLEGTICALALLACAVAPAQGFGNPTNDAACAALLRVIVERRDA